LEDASVHVCKGSGETDRKEILGSEKEQVLSCCEHGNELCRSTARRHEEGQLAPAVAARRHDSGLDTDTCHASHSNYVTCRVLMPPPSRPTLQPDYFDVHHEH